MFSSVVNAMHSRTWSLALPELNTTFMGENDVIESVRVKILCTHGGFLLRVSLESACTWIAPNAAAVTPSRVHAAVTLSRPSPPSAATAPWEAITHGLRDWHSFHSSNTLICLPDVSLSTWIASL